MATSNEEQQLGTLEKLGVDDLKRFQWHLLKEVLDELGPIPKSRLEGAARTDTVDRMVETYSNGGALKMKQHDLAESLMSKCSMGIINYLLTESEVMPGNIKRDLNVSTER